MQFLLDTNVVSEPVRKTPDSKVEKWLRAQSTLDLWISVLTMGEVTAGVELAPAPRQDELRRWMTQELSRAFVGRVLPVDDAVARAWGQLSAEARRQGRPLSPIDGLLLGTAKVHDLVFVTRNERDCMDRGVDILNPWS